MQDTAGILVIEDDLQIRRFLRTGLNAERYRLQEALTGSDGITFFVAHRPDVILLDLGLPDMDGVDVIKQVRIANPTIPIIVLSVRSLEQEKIKALDAGADDYVNKPFALGELLARVRAALRRTQSAAEAGVSVFQTGDIEVDLAKRRVIIGGQEVHLTRIEYKLLELLIRHADHVVTHHQLLEEIWGASHREQTHYLRVHMLQLRRKLEREPAHPRYLRTEPGVGYRLVTQHLPESWKVERHSETIA
jgi:two-component system, OmpR family, KDP operon response regulator KdpE